MKVGQYFMSSDGSIYMLAQVGMRLVCLVNITNGNRWNEPTPVVCSSDITDSEFKQICNVKDTADWFTPLDRFKMVVKIEPEKDDD